MLILPKQKLVTGTETEGGEMVYICVWLVSSLLSSTSLLAASFPSSENSIGLCTPLIHCLCLFQRS